jgi:bacillithiol biosynthesis cysteine-adding enzyme BshC
MECSCVRHTDVPGTSKLFIDLIHNFDRVGDLYPFPPNDIDSLVAASKFDFPDARRAALVSALRPLNQGNPSLAKLAQHGTVAVVTGQQVGLFSGPAYTTYKALTAIKAARTLADRGIPAVPVFWLATEDHDFAEVNHVWVFGADYQPVQIRINAPDQNESRSVGEIGLRDIPVAELRNALTGLPFADDAIGLIERAYLAGETMGSAFGRVIAELFAKDGLLLIDPMDRKIRELAAPFMKQAVELMPELVDELMTRSKELVNRGYHAQVLVDAGTSLVFLLEDGRRIALPRDKSDGAFIAPHRKFSPHELAQRAAALSPNALLRPVLQDYLLPSAAYIGGPAELAYLAQSQVLYGKLLGRQPAAFPRAGFTLIDARTHKRMARYGLKAPDLFVGQNVLRNSIAARLVPETLCASLERTRAAFAESLDALGADLGHFDVTLAAALETSRRKIEYQVGKISRKTAAQMLARDERAGRDASALSGLVFPEKHLQERFYSIIPFIAKFGPGLLAEIYSAVQIECADHQFAVIGNG